MTIRFAKAAKEKMPAKQLVSLRLDPDVIEAYRSLGPGYQVQMNLVLRMSMPKHANPVPKQAAKGKK